MTTWANGFAVDDATGKVLFDVVPITDYYNRRPVNVPLGKSVGTQGGVAFNYIAGLGQGVDADGNQLYLDLNGGAFPAFPIYNSGLYYADGGRLICDSNKPITGYATGGVPLTADGAVAIINPNPPKPGINVVTETGTPVVTEVGTNVISGA